MRLDQAAQLYSSLGSMDVPKGEKVGEIYGTLQKMSDSLAGGEGNPQKKDINALSEIIKSLRTIKSKSTPKKSAAEEFEGNVVRETEGYMMVHQPGATPAFSYFAKDDNYRFDDPNPPSTFQPLSPRSAPALPSQGESASENEGGDDSELVRAKDFGPKGRTPNQISVNGESPQGGETRPNAETSEFGHRIPADPFAATVISGDAMKNLARRGVGPSPGEDDAPAQAADQNDVDTDDTGATIPDGEFKGLPLGLEDHEFYKEKYGSSRVSWDGPGKTRPTPSMTQAYKRYYKESVAEVGRRRQAKLFNWFGASGSPRSAGASARRRRRNR